MNYGNGSTSWGRWPTIHTLANPNIPEDGPLCRPNYRNSRRKRFSWSMVFATDCQKCIAAEAKRANV